MGRTDAQQPRPAMVAILSVLFLFHGKTIAFRSSHRNGWIVGPLGLEPRTRGLKVRCSKPTELEALAQLRSCSQLLAEQRSDLHQFLWSERDVENAELHGEASSSITSDDPGDRSTALELQQDLLAAVSFYFIHIHVDPGNFEIPTRRLRAGCSASELRIRILLRWGSA